MSGQAAGGDADADRGDSPADGPPGTHRYRLDPGGPRWEPADPSRVLTSPLSSGIILPSLSSLLYLLCFQVMCTWWAWRGRVPAALFRCVSVLSLLYSASHFLLFYCYQLPSLQEAWPANCTSSR